MKLIRINVINVILTTLFMAFNVLITYNENIDNNLWLVPGLIICGITLLTSLTIAIVYTDLFSEILFFINIILALYYIYPILYEFI
ncbi:hypothetical protein V2K33_09620 [Staphylococcus saccharolyticus]|uniref:type II toxin-antitoxin system antitoxin TsaA n=1 Tax=Staphylococcus saccharolyticus TaxID=33028 RepID=UPI0032DF4B38